MGRHSREALEGPLEGQSISRKIYVPQGLTEKGFAGSGLAFGFRGE